jgi:rSAM/selenodomain-associated transferase 1
MRAEIVVFGRVPVPGRVKTRLAEALGPDAAAEVYRALLEHVLAEACATELPVTLALAEPSRVDNWHVPAGLRIEHQATGDLGKRMRSAFSGRFAAGAQAIVLVGSDVPAISADHLLQAVAALTRVPVVLGPATDGGYWLMGQRSPGLDLFSGVPWSSPRTMQATRDRLLGLAVMFEELAALRDLDTTKDLETVVTDENVDRELRHRLGAVLRRRPLAR